MTKQEYLQTMEESLTKFSKEETAPMMEYFREYMAETNLEMEEILRELGSPEELVKDLTVALAEENSANQSLPMDFALLALNGMDSEEGSFFLKAVYRSLVAAFVVEAFLQKETSRALSADEISALNGDLFAPEFLGAKEKNHTLPEWLSKVKRVSNKKIRAMVRPFMEKMQQRGKLDVIHSLLENDLYYEEEAFEMTEFRVEKIAYQRILIEFKKDWLEKGMPSNRTIALYWLLEQNGLLGRLFNAEEQAICAEQKAKRYHKNDLAKMLWKETVLSPIVRLAKDSMLKKVGFFQTAVGIGLAFSFPFLAKKEAIFIVGENWISKTEEVLPEIVGKIRQKGHRCLILRKGKVPLVEIDNVLYEAIPHIRTFRYSSVFGLQFRRYVM